VATGNRLAIKGGCFEGIVDFAGEAGLRAALGSCRMPGHGWVGVVDCRVIMEIREMTFANARAG
jgi:hypothetical protein